MERRIQAPRCCGGMQRIEGHGYCLPQGFDWVENCFHRLTLASVTSMTAIRRRVKVAAGRAASITADAAQSTRGHALGHDGTP